MPTARLPAGDPLSRLPLAGGVGLPLSICADGSCAPCGSGPPCPKILFSFTDLPDCAAGELADGVVCCWDPLIYSLTPVADRVLAYVGCTESFRVTYQPSDVVDGSGTVVVPRHVVVERILETPTGGTYQTVFYGSADNVTVDPDTGAVSVASDDQPDGWDGCSEDTF